MQLICTTELTYQEIVYILDVPKRTVEYVRMLLFDAFAVKTRVGLALIAHKYHVFNIDQFQEGLHVEN